MPTAAVHATDRTLDWQFRSGAIHLYFAIPSAVFHQLIAASSKGAYFTRNIRNHLRYQRVA